LSDRARPGLERFADAYDRAVGLCLAAITVAIGLAMVVMGNTLARAIGVVLLALILGSAIRTMRRR